MGVPQHAGHCFEAKSDIIAALGALAECSSQLENEPLKGAVGTATNALVGHVEGCCRELVEFLLGGPCAAADSDDVAYDKLWTLRLMGLRSEVSRGWILEAGGAAAVSRTMAAHPAHDKLQKEGTWLMYILCGVEGIIELLRGNRGSPPVQEAAAWAVYELAVKQRDRGQAGCSEWPEAEDLVVLLLDALRTQAAAPLDLFCACCSALRMLIESQPCRGSFFVERGGDSVVLAALAAGQAAGAAGESLLVAGMQLIASLVEGNAYAAQRLRSLGALEGLVACGLSLPGKVTDETMWTLGQVGGVLAVLQVMARASEDDDARGAVRSGLAAIAKLTWMPLEEGLQQQYPQAAEALLGLARRVGAERPTEDVVCTLQALGGVLHVLTPHVAPGSWSVVDDAVKVLMEAVGPNNDELVAQAAVASLGHIASRSPAWRKPLQAALGDLGRRMRVPGERDEIVKHQKCLFWASAVIAGVPVVLREMLNQPNSPNVQDAGISAIVDILDDHADGPACEESGIEPSQVPGAIEAIAGSMRLHRANVPVQCCGCHALGLLNSALPVEEPVHAEALDSILASLRWHPDEYRVASGACSALRAFLEPRRGSRAPDVRGGGCNGVAGVAASAAGQLRARDVGSSVRRVLEAFGSNTGNKGFLEDVLYVLGLTEGVPAVLQVLAASESDDVPLRCAGLKALVELGRAFPDLLAPPRCQEVQQIAGAIMLEAQATQAAARPGSASSDCVELLWHVELVRGMVGA